MSNVLYGFEIAVALGLIIFVHELGHFLAAKWAGVHVRKFAMGMGPAIIKWTRGETEYSLRCIPVGGFVDLAGEQPESDDAHDPGALCNRPPWKRAIVFAAGVTMNALLALVLFALAPVVGMQVPVPIVGEVVPDTPAAKAGLEPGDRILTINSEKIESFEDIMMAVALRRAGTSFDLVVARAAEGSDTPQELTKTVTSKRNPGFPAPMLGILPDREAAIARMHTTAVLRQTGIEEGDRILAVNGQPVETWRGLDKALEDAPAGPLTLGIERGEERRDIRVVPADLKVYDYGMKWPTQIAGVEAGSPAEQAGIQAGDRIAGIADTPWPATETIIETVKAAGDGGTVRVTLWREGKLIDVTCKATKKKGEDHPRLGIALGRALDVPIQVGHVDPGGAADQAHLRPGDIVRRVGESGKEPRDWNDLSELLLATDGKDMLVQVERGGSLLTNTLRPTAVPQERLTLTGAIGMPRYIPLPRIYSPLAVATRSLKRTFLMFWRVYATLRQLLTGEAGSEAIAGPVGIVQYSYNVAGYGVGTFMDFWGMLSVCIAVMNFLPLPPFDGGHVLFLLLEKIKGSPFSLKLRTAIWIVGWVGVGLLFLLITYQDITRWIESM
ncbi:MAG TPA: RIP metalloprotease RseP [Phycisphaerae bacterium]|nr:RIP metalloprotease RseP [Phycisphaerae bacterium]